MRGTAHSGEGHPCKRPWGRRTVSWLAAAAVLLVVAGPRTGSGAAAREIRLTQLSFELEASLGISGGQARVLTFECTARPPDQLTVVLSNRSGAHLGQDDYQLDFFAEKVGFAVSVDGCQAIMFNPWNEQTIDWGLNAFEHQVPQPGRNIETGRPPDIAPYLRDLVLCGQEPERQERALDDGGRELEITYPRPWKVVEPHFIAKVRQVVGPDDVLRQSEAIDPDGKVVETTTYSDLREVKPGVRVPTKSETIIAAGSTPVAITVGVQDEGKPKRDEQWVADIPYPERRIVRTYSWIADKYWLPANTTVYEGDEPVMAITFRNYRVESE